MTTSSSSSSSSSSSRTTHQKKSVHQGSGLQDDHAHKEVVDPASRSLPRTNKKSTLSSNRVQHAIASSDSPLVVPTSSSSSSSTSPRLKSEVSRQSLKSKAVAATGILDKGLSSSSSSSSSPVPREPSSPVLVNPPASAMHLSMSSNPAYKIHTRTKRPLEKSPSPASFSINSILSSLQSDDITQADVECSIDGIAQIYARSNLSLSNSYGFHRTPIGSGPDIEDEIEDEDHRLTLDTNAAVQHTKNLETVEELPTPLSSHSRKGSDPLEMFSIQATSTTVPSTSSIADPEDDGPLQPLATWQIRARRGKTTSRSVSALSIGIEARGNTESFTLQDHPDLRHDVSGTGNSRAVRQLQRVAGK